MGERWIFDGHIAGIGTASGLRAVVGVWQQSPFGSFAGVMVQQASGHRLLLAPTEEVAAFISATYGFDSVKILEVDARFEDRLLTVEAGPLQLRASMGGRPLLGNALRMVPRPLAVHTAWLRTTLVDAAGDKSPSSRLLAAALGPLRASRLSWESCVSANRSSEPPRSSGCRAGVIPSGPPR